MLGVTPLHIGFDTVERFIRLYDETGYLVLLGSKKVGAIYSRIRYLISQKSGITYFISNNYTKIKVDSFLTILTILNFHNVIILIKSVFNKDKKLKVYSYE